jgi:hypothetical protein
MTPLQTPLDPPALEPSSARLPTRKIKESPDPIVTYRLACRTATPPRPPAATRSSDTCTNA